jgi:hypothetical protein
MSTESEKVLVVHWEWAPGTKYAGSKFWATHSVDIDGRILNWPRENLIPLGATEATVVDGDGLDLVRACADRTEANNKKMGWGRAKGRSLEDIQRDGAYPAAKASDL